MVPLATRTLATWLAPRLPDARVSVVDFPVGTTPEEMLARLEAQAPDVVGLSCYLWNHAAHFALVDLLHRRRPETAVVMGGPQLAYDDEDLARVRARHPGIALLVQGEGERALLDYLRTPRAARPAAGAGAVVRGEPRDDLERDGDGPALLDAHPPDAEISALEIETQRGCLFRCAFCYVPRMGPRVRSRSRAWIERELRWAMEHRVPSVGYANAGLNLDADHLRTVVELARAADPGGTLLHIAEVDHRRLEPPQIDLLAQLRMRVGMGLQSVGETSNRLMNRRFEAGPFRAAVAALKGVGLTVMVEMIVGLPGDTLDDVRATMDFALALDCRVAAFVLRVLPGTEFYHRRHEYGLVYDEADGHQLVSSRWLTRDDLARAAAELRARAAAAAAAGREGDVRFWDRDAVDLTRAARAAATADALRAHVAAFFAQLPGLRLEETKVEAWGAAEVQVCRVRLRTGEVFRLGFARPEAALEALAETPAYKLVFVAAPGEAPAPAVQRTLEALRHWARGPGRGAAGAPAR
jgi:radical SAM superfamily enzyme YgiQ (UPF0313 family)